MMLINRIVVRHDDAKHHPHESYWSFRDLSSDLLSRCHQIVRPGILHLPHRFDCAILFLKGLISFRFYFAPHVSCSYFCST